MALRDRIPGATTASDSLGEDQKSETTSSHGNAALVRRAIEEIWNQGNFEVADTIFTAAYVNVGGLIPDLIRGPEAIKLAAALHHTAFPGLHITIERLISEGALVAFQWSARNQSTDDEVGTAPRVPTGTLQGTTFCRLASGKIVESWTNWDSSEVLRKLVGPPGGGPGRTVAPPGGLH